MKSREEIEKVLKNKKYKNFENIFGIKIRNGQAVPAIRKALEWVLSDLDSLPKTNYEKDGEK